MTPRQPIRSENGVSRRNFLTTVTSCAVASHIPLMASHAANRSAAKTPVVDTHMHVWSDGKEPFPFSHPYQAKFKRPKIAATVERLVDDMDKNGVTHSIIVQTIFHGWDNAYTVHCVKKHPQRFKGHGLIDPTKADVAEKLEYWMQEHGLAGMRFSPIYYLDGKHGGDGWMTSKAHHRLWKKAEQFKAVFNMFISTRQLPKLEIMLRQFPGVRVVVDHLSQIDLGGDDVEPAMKNLLALARYKNVWVKVSELASVSKSGKYPFPDALPWVKRVYDAFGPDQLLWGTGYPGAVRAEFSRPTLKKELELIREKIPFFTADDQKKILGLNAARIWGLKSV